jgi:hypothetical protein
LEVPFWIQLFSSVRVEHPALVEGSHIGRVLLAASSFRINSRSILIQNREGGDHVVTSTPVTDQEEQALDEKRTPEQREALAKLLTSAEEQGIKPIDWDALRAKADFWPEEESIDDFIDTIDEWRREGHREDLR